MGERLRVLIAEDSKDDVDALVRALRYGSYDPVVEWVETAEAMRTALDQRDWDIVISDYALPQFSVQDALQVLRESDPDVPLIIVSNTESEDLAVAVMETGARDYVMRDNLARLLPTVRRELREAQVRRAHRQAEAALQDSQSWYRSLVETSPDAIFVADLKGRLVMANQRAAELRGCQQVEDLLGRNVFDFLAPTDRQRAFVDARRAVEAGGIRNLEYILLTEDGTQLAIELNATMIKDAEGAPTAVLGVLRDITDRVQARDEIRHLKEFNEGIVQNMAEGIVVEDAEGYLTFVNRAAATMLGYVPEQLVGLKGQTIVAPDQYHIVEAANERRLRGESDRYEVDLCRKDGTPVHVLVSGSPRFDAATGEFAGTMGVFTDITERKRAEDALKERNRELALLNRVSRALSIILDQDQLLLTILNEVRRALNVAATSLWLTDPVTGELVCQEATGSQRETVRGWRLQPEEGIAGWVVRHGESLIVPDTRKDPRHFKGVDQQIGLGVRSILSVPLRARQDVIGALQVVDVEVNRFKPSDLTLIEPLAATAAIAIENARLFAREEQRAAELAHALEQQRELDRLKDQFIQNVSHELRTPLGLVQAYAQLLADGELGDLQPSQHEPIAVIARRTQMLSKIVEDLTAILETETQKTQYEAVDLADMVNKLMVDFDVAAEHAGLSLRVEVEPDLPLVAGDPTHLNQVLDNLLQNALKFTPSGGSIAVSLARADEGLVLKVADTGVGIPSDKLDRVFERFYQVDGSMSRRYGGAGLGLALVKDVVEAHGGTVDLESELGRGSTFTVTLPFLMI